MSTKKKDSLKWWEEQVSTFSPVLKWGKDEVTGKRKRIKKPYTKMKGRFIAPGAMLVYKYQAKYASTLPFWDKHPMTIIFAESPRHFVGMNLHYIHPKFRPVLMKKIIRLNRLRIKKDRRFTLQYKDIKNFIMANRLKVSIRKYIKARMSNVRFVPGADWIYAANLPSEKFVFKGNIEKDKLYQLIQATGRRAR